MSGAEHEHGHEAGPGETTLQVFVREGDARCPACAYSLSGLEGAQCPECGRGLRVGLMVEGRSSAWWFGVLGLSLGAALSVVVLAAIAVMVTAGGWDDEGLALLTAVLGIVILGGQSWALSRWLAGGRRTGAGMWGMGGGVAAWVIGFGPLLGLWGVMFAVMAFF